MYLLEMQQVRGKLPPKVLLVVGELLRWFPRVSIEVKPRELVNP